MKALNLLLVATCLLSPSISFASDSVSSGTRPAPSFESSKKVTSSIFSSEQAKPIVAPIPYYFKPTIYPLNKNDAQSYKFFETYLVVEGYNSGFPPLEQTFIPPLAYNFYNSTELSASLSFCKKTNKINLTDFYSTSISDFEKLVSLTAAVSYFDSLGYFSKLRSSPNFKTYVESAVQLNSCAGKDFSVKALALASFFKSKFADDYVEDRPLSVSEKLLAKVSKNSKPVEINVSFNLVVKDSKFSYLVSDEKRQSVKEYLESPELYSNFYEPVSALAILSDADLLKEELFSLITPLRSSNLKIKSAYQEQIDSQLQLYKPSYDYRMY